MINRKEIIIKFSNILSQKLNIGNKKDILNITQKAVIYYLIAGIKPDDTALKEENIRLNDFCDLFNINHSGGKNRKNIVNSIKQLSQKEFYIDGKTKHWVEDNISFSKNNTEFNIKIHQDLKEYLFKLEDKYTYFLLGYICQFKHKYSWRLYEFCHSWIEQKNIIVPIKEAYSWFGFQQYNNYDCFKRRVIIPAVTEINAYSDINVKIHEYKNGKKKDMILFTITQKSDEEIEKIKASFKIENTSLEDDEFFLES